MKTLKTITTISLFNLIAVISLVFLGQQLRFNSAQETSEIQTTPTAIVNSAATTIVPTAAPYTNSTNTTVKNSTPTKAPDNRCLIMIQGVKYDVTDFRKIHSGGDIFQCGKDMTAIFLGQHNTSTLQQMAKYRVN